MKFIQLTRFIRESGFDASTSTGRMMVNLMVTLGQFEREQTAERVAINCHSRAMRGYVNGGRAVLGFARHPERKGVLIVDENEAEMVRTIFDLFLIHGTRAKTILALHEKLIFPKRTIKTNDSGNPVKWTTQTLGNVLNQAAYIGYKEVNKIYKADNQDTLKPWQKYKMVKASWPPIIEESKFWEAQRLLEEASVKERERLQSGERKTFFLSHLLICGECGRALVGQSAHGKSGNIHRYYYHSRKFDDQDCKRPRLHAGVIEDKLIGDLKKGLEAAGYFEDLENIIAANAKSQTQHSKSDLERLKKELTEVTNEVSGIWRLQSQANLDEDSLKLASQQLGLLAARKKTIEVQIEEMKEIEADASSVKDQVKFVEGNIKDLMKGWSKATNTLKKRLLRRAIKRIIVTKDEMKVVFWLSADARDGSNPQPKAADSDSSADILEFRRRSRLAADGSNQNLSISGSLIGKIGSGNHYLPELSQVHKKTTFSGAERQRVFENLVELYINGLSLSDIAKQTGKSKTTIRSALVKAGVRIRSSIPAPFSTAIRDSAKTNAAPYFGFCFFQGQVIPDPKEFVNLQLIHELWKNGTNPNRIADRLNEKKIRPRCAQKWNRNSIVKIINRFENKSVILKSGGKYELR